MTPPIRPVLYSLTDRVDIATLRDGVEWYKRVVRGAEPLGMLTAIETRYVNEQWAEVCRDLAKVHGVPAGSLSYWLNELAVNELRLSETALEEGAAATAYGQVQDD